ncbi:MAG: hypothetical protein M1834_004649 [Cirrosporium novae-zelandiae]|nr:MAG: hypothetical protein M1834_004649 [Cirrosporium novae-zelandiae]
MARKYLPQKTDKLLTSSTLIISPNNEVLLLKHQQELRISPSDSSSPNTSNAPNALRPRCLFPSGRLQLQDGVSLKSLRVPYDNFKCRQGAIREVFEKTGLLLVKDRDNEELASLKIKDRDNGRLAVMKRVVKFHRWLKHRRLKEANLDIKSFIPFTRWISPHFLPNRTNTQTYLYFLPLAPSTPPTSTEQPKVPSNPDHRLVSASTIPPKHTEILSTNPFNGGTKITSLEFASPSTWLERANAGEIILPPPEYYLLHLLSQFLTPHPTEAEQPLLQKYEKDRAALMGFITSGTPPFGNRAICPQKLNSKESADNNNKIILALDNKPEPGTEMWKRGNGEVEETETGDPDRFIIADFTDLETDGPRGLEVVWREEFLKEMGNEDQESGKGMEDGNENENVEGNEKMKKEKLAKL